MDEIKELIQKYPRHFSVMTQKNDVMKRWVEENTKITNSTNWAEHVWSALTEQDNICKNGNIKKFKNINDGFGFCGPAGKCDCARAEVSKKVSLSKSLRTADDIAAENIKRVKTSVEKYGVVNNAQTEGAIAAHKEIYADKATVAVITARIQKTKNTNHGDKNFNNRSKAEQTCMTKYGVKNTWSLSIEKQNPNLVILRDKHQLSEIFPKFSVEEIATMYNLHTQTVYYYLNLHGFREPYKSTFEQEIVFFLRSLGVSNIITNTRKLIGKEIDIFLPDHNLAIEFNGLYWHHDKIPHVSKSYHHDKFKKCEERGITLFTIFSDSWAEKKDVWKNKIKAKIRASNTIFARKTTVVELQPTDTRVLLNTHHVQGYCTSQICYGLRHGDDIVAVMTFSKKRVGIGKIRTGNAYELVRYVTSNTVVGGASKLLSHFIKKHLPDSIYSYSDNRYSVGDMYIKLGFQLEKENKHGYWYYDPQHKKSYHRMNFTKNKLVSNGFDPSKTEYDIMDERGFLRIWDCGSRTWVLHINPE